MRGHTHHKKMTTQQKIPNCVLGLKLYSERLNSPQCLPVETSAPRGAQIGTRLLVWLHCHRCRYQNLTETLVPESKHRGRMQLSYHLKLSMLGGMGSLFERMQVAFWVKGKLWAAVPASKSLLEIGVCVRHVAAEHVTTSGSVQS
jgi:hypothetical protein